MQVLAYSVASVGVSAFSGGLIDGAKAEEVMNTLRSLTEDSQQVSRKKSVVSEIVSGGENVNRLSVLGKALEKWVEVSK